MCLTFGNLKKIHKGVCRGKIGRIDFLIDPLMDCSLDLPLFYDERNYLIWRLLYRLAGNGRTILCFLPRDRNITAMELSSYRIDMLLMFFT